MRMTKRFHSVSHEWLRNLRIWEIEHCFRLNTGSETRKYTNLDLFYILFRLSLIFRPRPPSYPQLNGTVSPFPIVLIVSINLRSPPPPWGRGTIGN